MKKILFSIVLLVFCTQLWADTLFVRPGDYSKIQDAINDADDGDKIIVDPCTYYENINFLGKAITLTSTDPNDPNVITATIIDGSLHTDPNIGSVVTFNSGETNNSVLTGFTITGGTGSWLVVAWDLHEAYWNRCGGGILCYNLSQPTITKNVITNNMTGEGGGIYIYGGTADDLNDLPYLSDPPNHIQPIISHNIISDNDANKYHPFSPPDSNYAFEEHGDGGAIVCFQGVDANVIGNTMNNNHADYYGGAIHFRQWSNGIIQQNDIADNDSALGAGVHITYSSSPTIRNNIIERNIAGGFGGGGIYVYYLSNPVIEKNLITQNESTNGAGIGTYWESEPIIRNNIIANNINGAGIIIKGGSTPKIINNTIVGNTATYGGIEYLTDSSPNIENNIIVSNNGYGIYSSSGQQKPIVKYNNVWGNELGSYSPDIGDQNGINGNISVDPCFVDVNDYRIGYLSPCRDSGNSTVLVFDDFIGNPRPAFNAPDIGAYELQIYDITATGTVDYSDLNLMTESWLSGGDSSPADLDDSNFIDWYDFSILTNDWQK